LKKIMEEVDLNIDGKINFEEFTKFMKQLIK
jgi:Ca2+-binding EF-hand superfamily protein